MGTRIVQVALLLANMLVASTAFAVCSVNITSGPADPTSSTSAAFYFTKSGCSGGGFQCKLDAGSYASCTSPKSYSSLSEGAHTFSVKFVQGFPNPASRPDAHTWTIDTTAPTTTLTSGPPAYTNDPTPTFTFTSSEGGTFECNLDDSTYVACSSPATSAVLDAGAHRLLIRAKDLAGNYDASPVSVAFTVGRVQPWTNRAIWGLETSGLNLLAFASSNMGLVQDITGGADAQAFAADEGGDAMWILRSDDVLAAYTHAGSLSTTATPPTSPQAGEPVGLVVDIEDGSAWTGYGTKIYNYSTSGSLVRTVTTASEIQALAFDTGGDRLLVALEGSIIGISDSTGSVSTIATLTGLGEPVGLTLDTYTRDIWVLTDTHLVGYDASGAATGSKSVSGGTRVAGDGLGGLWVAKTADLLRYSPNANEVVENIQPFGPSGTILDITADAFTGEVWVSDGSSIKRYDNDAVLEAEYVRAASKFALTSDNAYRVTLVDKRGTGASMHLVDSVWKIYTIFAGSGAEAADIRVNDELLSINGIDVPETDASVEDHDAFLAAVAAARSGSSDTVVIFRDGNSYAKSVTTGLFQTDFRRNRLLLQVDILAASSTTHPVGEGCWQCKDLTGPEFESGSTMCDPIPAGFDMCVDEAEWVSGLEKMRWTCTASGSPNCNHNYS